MKDMVSGVFYKRYNTPANDLQQPNSKRIHISIQFATREVTL